MLMLIGQHPDEQGIARGVFFALGVAALSDIKSDYVRKARGETGEDGTRWPPLSPKYLAYGRRFGKGEQNLLQAGSQTPCKYDCFRHFELYL